MAPLYPPIILRAKAISASALVFLYVSCHLLTGSHLASFLETRITYPRHCHGGPRPFTRSNRFTPPGTLRGPGRSRATRSPPDQLRLTQSTGGPLGSGQLGSVPRSHPCVAQATRITGRTHGSGQLGSQRPVTSHDADHSNTAGILVAYLETLIAFSVYYRADDPHMSGKMDQFYTKALGRWLGRTGLTLHDRGAHLDHLHQCDGVQDDEDTRRQPGLVWRQLPQEQHGGGGGNGDAAAPGRNRFEFAPFMVEDCLGVYPISPSLRGLMYSTINSGTASQATPRGRHRNRAGRARIDYQTKVSPSPWPQGHDIHSLHWLNVSNFGLH